MKNAKRASSCGRASLRLVLSYLTLLIVGSVGRPAYAVTDAGDAGTPPADAGPPDATAPKDTGGPETAPPAPVTIMPPSATVGPLAKLTFTASGGTGAGYAWSLTASPSGGTITAGGMYTAGATANVVDKVRVVDSAMHSASANVTVTSGVTIMPVSATVAAGAMQTFVASGGTPPYTWSLTTDGSGTMAAVSATGIYTAGVMAGMDVVTATDSTGDKATADITVIVMKVGIGAACTSSVSCPTGATCVDGVCCSTSCGGQCQACNAANSMGTCVTISGPPVGTRPACPQSDPNNVCSSLICDGTSPASCTSIVGAETSCGIASCVDGVGTPGAVCTGDGGCQPVVPKSCGEYGCVSDRCATSCNNSSDCSPGNYCQVTSGKCLRPAALPDAGMSPLGSTPAADTGGCSVGGVSRGLSPVLFLAGIGAIWGVRRKRRRR